MENNHTVLFDYDSMIYKAVYKICSFADIRKWFNDGRERDWMEREILNLTLNRLANMGDAIFLDIEDTGIEIFEIEYFLTACKNSVRKKLDPQYKAKRKKNKWVNMVRKHILEEMNFATVHDEYEADDLIKDRAVELEDQFIILSLDKDLHQIAGIHFDFYRPILKDENGNFLLDENGHRKIAPCRGLSIVTPSEAKRFFWLQMLMGDSGDNIKGIPRIGKVKANRILNHSTNFENTVLEEYQNYFGDELGKKEFDKHKILIGLGIKHRP